MKRVFKTHAAGRHLSRVGHRRVGSGARQHAVARRPGADGRDRPFRDAVAEDGDEARARGRVHARRLAPRRRSATRSRSALRADTRQAHQGGVRGAQRDLDRRHYAHRARCARRSTRRSIRRCSWSTRSRRSPRSTTGTTSGASTSPSRGSQKGLMLPPGLSFNAISRQGARRAQDGAAAAQLLGTGTRCSANGKSGYFPYTPATNLLYGLREALAMLLDEEGLDERVRAPPAPRARRRAARCAPGASRCSALDPREYSGSLTAVLMPAGHDADALRKVDPRQLRHVARHRARQARGQGVPHRPLGDFNDLTLLRHARRRRDGARARRRAAQEGRRAAAMSYLAGSGPASAHGAARAA